ncbi:MAG: hypothetical protein JSW28_10065 [Thermoplasmata archaeon]|nr:MAG: hypothetical protein JSW28_10065 [Thermoplasmata archaeon]
MKQRILAIAILTAMIIMGSASVFGGDTDGPVTYFLAELPYEWDTDIGLPLYASDDSVHHRTMGHQFTLYDMTTSILTISSNGWVKLGMFDDYMSYYNNPIGSYDFDADYAIMPFWDDMNPSAEGEVYYYTSPQKTVITWMAVPHFMNFGSHTFQLVLKGENSFRLNYRAISPPCPSYYSSPTVGVVRQDNAVDGTQFYYTDGYTELGTRITGGMSIGLDTPPTRYTIFEENFVSDPGWKTGSDFHWSGGRNLWHWTSDYRSDDRDEDGSTIDGHLYFGSDVTRNYDFGVVGGFVRSPIIGITGQEPELEVDCFARTEEDHFRDNMAVQISVNGGPFEEASQIISPAGSPAHPPSQWDRIKVPITANDGDSVQIQFVFHTIDGQLNHFEGWRVDNFRITVALKKQFAELAVVDSGFIPETIAPGGGGMAFVTVANTGDCTAEIEEYSWEGFDIAVVHELGEERPKTIAPGEQQTYCVAVLLYPNTPSGSVTYLNFELDYNSRTGEPLKKSMGIIVQGKIAGLDRSDYVHSQNALRHIRRLDYNIKGCYVTDSGELADAIEAFLAGEYKTAKSSAVEPGGPDLGFWGLEPGRLQSNGGAGLVGK